MPSTGMALTYITDNDITDDIQKRVQVYVERMLHDKTIDDN